MVINSVRSYWEGEEDKDEEALRRAKDEVISDFDECCVNGVEDGSQTGRQNSRQ